MTRFSLFVLLATALTLAGCQPPAMNSEVDDSGNGSGTTDQHVVLTIDFGAAEHAPVDFRMDWTEGITAMDLLLAAARNDTVNIGYTGSGETAFVNSLGDVEGGIEKNRWWIYTVNDEVSHTGAGVRQLQPGDRVHWYLGVYE